MADTVDLKSTELKLMGVRVPLVVPYQSRLVMKKKTKKIRNPIAVAMHKRCKGGPMKDKREKRQNGKNEQQEYLKELD